MDQKDPDIGAVNAVDPGRPGLRQPAGRALRRASPRRDDITGTPEAASTLKMPLGAGDTALLGLTGDRARPTCRRTRCRRCSQSRCQGGINGVVWRDFNPGGGKPGKVEPEELGLPGVTVELVDAAGDTVASTRRPRRTARSPSTTSSPATTGSRSAQETFAQPFEGVSWLGAKLITPAIMLAYIWVWAGFAMVVIAAGLAAIPRDTLEAARTDGATEWQVFRRVTVPLLAPVLCVVFITMLINVLKVFDIVIVGRARHPSGRANVIALAMWRTSFGGVNDFGLGSAIAVFLFLLVIPILRSTSGASGGRSRR